MDYPENILEITERRIGTDKLLPKGTRVLAACSGGPDSTALLDLLRRLSQKLGFVLGAIHVDHGQGPDSGRVARLVARRCRRWNIPLWREKLNRETHPAGSGETYLRAARYSRFARVLKESGYHRIATGHTASDNAETILMRVLRGTSVAGLCGIPASRDDTFVRPMIDISRGQIMSYLKSRRLSYHTDPTNLDGSNIRAILRKRVLPLIRERVNPELDQALLRLSRAAERDNAAIVHLTPKLQFGRPLPGRLDVDWQELLNLEPAQKARVVLKMFRELKEDSFSNMELKHLDRVLNRLGDRGLKRWTIELFSSFCAGREKGRFYLDDGRELSSPAQVHLGGPGEYAIPGRQWTIKLEPRQARNIGPTASHEVWFDMTEIEFPLTIRNSRPGDRINPWGMKGSKKVARLLMDEGIPQKMRKSIPLLVMGDEVLWVIGLRRSRAAPLKNDRNRALHIEARLTEKGSDPILL